MSETLEVQDEGRLRVLRLNRPERKNALDRDLIAALHREFRDAAWTTACGPSCSPATATASAPGSTSAKRAVSDTAPASDDDVPAPRDGTRSHLTVVMRVECEKPILAGVNGVAVGAGVSLAMNADIRIAAPSARFHPGYTRIGLSPDLGLTWTLPRAIGYERAMRFMLEQRMVPANEALELGLVSEVVERDEDLDDRLLEYGTMLATVAPIAARQTKRLMVRADEPADLVAHLDAEIELVMRALRSQDSAEAIRAMQARETPNFTAR